MNIAVKNTMFPYPNKHKYAWTSPDEMTGNKIDHILVDRRRHASVHGSGCHIVAIITVW